MKPTILLTAPPLNPAVLGRFGHTNLQASGPVLQPELVPIGNPPREFIRHILLGSPGAVRQTIHLLHTLRYCETVLWSPVIPVEEPLVITPEQGEAMSLLRKPM